MSSRETQAERQRATCANCGRSCGRWTLRPDRPGARCEECIRAIEAVRRSLVEGMWAQGWPWRTICAVVGAGNGSLSVWRARGWSLPYRYIMRRGVRIG